MWPNPQIPANFVTFNEKMLDGNLHFLWSASICSRVTIEKSVYVYDQLFDH